MPISEFAIVAMRLTVLYERHVHADASADARARRVEAREENPREVVRRVRSVHSEELAEFEVRYRADLRRREQLVVDAELSQVLAVLLIQL